MVIHPNFKTVTVTVIFGKSFLKNNKTAGNNFDSNAKQLKEARKGNGALRKENRWPRKGNGPPPVTGTEGLLIVEDAFNCSGSSYGFNCQVSRGAPKQWPKY